VVPDNGNQIFILDVVINIYSNCKLNCNLYYINYFKVLTCKYSNSIYLNVNYDNVGISADMYVKQLCLDILSSSVYILFKGIYIF
jgi:hypothetical protein